MKTTYLKPTTDEIRLTSGSVMISASADGENFIEDGGTTSEGGITEGESRGSRSIWDDEE